MILRISHFRFKKKYRQCKIGGSARCGFHFFLSNQLASIKKLSDNTLTVLEDRFNNPDLELDDRIHSLIKYMGYKEKNLVSNLEVKTAFIIGFLISQEEKRRGKPFNVFWKEISAELELTDVKFKSRSKLYEAKLVIADRAENLGNRYCERY